MVTDRAALVGILILAVLIVCILYVAFGQITVRKLRKNPQTKGFLGSEYMSGWDIINVAQALAFPRSWSKKIERSPLASMHANASVLREHTTGFDRALGATFYWLLMFSGLFGALLALFNALGAFSV